MKIIPVFILFLAAGILSEAQSPDDSAKYNGRINACFSASHPEIAENLCLFFTGSFRYTSSYGAVDQFAVGTYTASQDTIYLNSREAPAFKISARKNPSISASKVQIKFKNMGRNRDYILFGSDADQKLQPLGTQDGKTKYSYLIKRPESGQLFLQHTLFDKKSTAYNLDRGSNEFTVTISDSIGMLAFKNTAFVWVGNDLKTVDDDSKLFKNESDNQALSYQDIPKEKGNSGISESEFNALNQKQSELFAERLQKVKAAEKEKARLRAEVMAEDIKSSWPDAVKKARQDSSCILLLLGADSTDSRIAGIADQVSIQNTMDSGQTGNSFLPALYYQAMDDQEQGFKIPVLFHASHPDSALLKRFSISLLPAVLIVSNDGTPLFKKEGMVIAPQQILLYCKEVVEKLESEKMDSILSELKTAKPDSLAIVRMLGYFKNKAENELLDKLVSQYFAAKGYSIERYDLVLSNFSEEFLAGDDFSVENKDPTKSASRIYLSDHYGERIADKGHYRKDINDSLIIVASNIFNTLLIEGIYGLHSTSQSRNTCVELAKKMVTGNNRYLDFYNKILWLSYKYSQAKKDSIDLKNYESELETFLKECGGNLLSASTVDDSARALLACIRLADNKSFDNLYLQDATDSQFIERFRTITAYTADLLATVKMLEQHDSILTASVIRNSKTLEMLAWAASLRTSENGLLAKRNYAYALYVSGEQPKALKLLEEVIKLMEQQKNSFIANDKKIKKAKQIFEECKAGKKLKFKISDLPGF